MTRVVEAGGGRSRGLGGDDDLDGGLGVVSGLLKGVVNDNRRGVRLRLLASSDVNGDPVGDIVRLPGTLLLEVLVHVARADSHGLLRKGNSGSEENRLVGQHGQDVL